MYGVHYAKDQTLCVKSAKNVSFTMLLPRPTVALGESEVAQ